MPHDDVFAATLASLGVDALIRGELTADSAFVIDERRLLLSDDVGDLTRGDLRVKDRGERISTGATGSAASLLKTETSCAIFGRSDRGEASVVGGGDAAEDEVVLGGDLERSLR